MLKLKLIQYMIGIFKIQHKQKSLHVMEQFNLMTIFR